jgi:hypothetical protein
MFRNLLQGTLALAVERWKSAKSEPFAYLYCWIMVFLTCAGVLVIWRDNHSLVPLDRVNWTLLASVPTIACLVSAKRTNIALQYVLITYVLYVYGKSTGLNENYKGLRAPASVILLVLYLVVEAMEIALTQLTAGASDSIPNRDQALIADIGKNSDLFYEAREWLVILLIIGLTIFSDFEKLYLGNSLVITSRGASVAFSLVFTTVIVVWIAQSPGKTNARKDPVRWMELCAKLWPPLKVLGSAMEQAGLFAPGQQISRLLKAFLPKMHGVSALRTSQDDFYLTSLKRYGYALHALSDEIEIGDEGGAKHRQVGMFYIVAGNRTKFVRWFDCPEGVEFNEDGSPDISVRFTCWDVANFDQRIDDETRQKLRDLFITGDSKHFTQTKDFGLSSSVEPARDESGLESKRKYEVRLESEYGLPEDLRQQERMNDREGNLVFETENADLPLAIAIRYEIKVNSKPRNFVVVPEVEDYYSRMFDFPCRQYSSVFRLTDSLHHLKFDIPTRKALISRVEHSAESERISVLRRYIKRELRTEVEYPMPGVEYLVLWKLKMAQDLRLRATATSAPAHEDAIERFSVSATAASPSRSHDETLTPSDALFDPHGSEDRA